MSPIWGKCHHWHNPQMRILRKKKVNSGIIHTIREDIIITEFQRFFEDLLSKLDLFSKNANTSKIAK
jgi:hypothetical protein